MRNGTSTGSTRVQWYIDLGVKPENLRHYEHPKEKLAHYSKRTVDIEYKFGFQGSDWGELEGVATVPTSIFPRMPSIPARI